MPGIDIDSEGKVLIGCTAMSEPVQGFFALCAVRDVLASHLSNREVSEHDGGFTVSFYLMKVNFSLTSETGGAIDVSRYYRSLMLTVNSSEDDDTSYIQPAVSQFTSDLHRAISLVRGERVPALRRRVCRIHGKVKWDDIGLWWCAMGGHGLLAEDDTREAMTNPFDL